jgi:signal transduction histidine kinase
MQYRQIVQSVYDDVRHLSKLTQTLLEFAQASGDPGGLEIEMVRIDEILMRLPAAIKNMGNSNSVVLTFNDLPENEAQLIVHGNAELLFLAIKNIVTNACKYSDDHKATVNLAVIGSQVIITISDKGIGIAKSDLGKIFQPFYRVNNTNSPGGFGLGLSLSGRIIKLHKGNISVESVPGQGTTFTVQLPMAGF